MYVAASAGEGRTFQELFDYLGEFVSSPAVRFGLCRKAKSGSGPSPIAAVGRKQIYFEGAIQVLRAVLDADEKIASWHEQQEQQQQGHATTSAMISNPTTVSSSIAAGSVTATTSEGSSASSSSSAAVAAAAAPSSSTSSAATAAPEPWDPVPLHCGRLPVDKPEKYHRMVNIAAATLPHFLRNGPEAHEAYRVSLRQIAKLNGVTSTSVAKAARAESERLKAEATAAAAAEAAAKAGDGSAVGAAAVDNVGLAGLAKLLGCDVNKSSINKASITANPVTTATPEAAVAANNVAGADTYPEVAAQPPLPLPTPLPESLSSDLPTILAPSSGHSQSTTPLPQPSIVEPKSEAPKLPAIALGNSNAHQNQSTTSLSRPASCHFLTSLPSSSTPTAAASAGTSTSQSISKDSDSANSRSSWSRDVGSVARLKAVRSFRDLKSDNLIASPLPGDRSRNNSNHLPRSGSMSNLRGRHGSSSNGTASAPSTPPRKLPESSSLAATTAVAPTSSSTPASPATVSQRRARRDSSSLGNGNGSSSNNMSRRGGTGQSLPRSGKRSAPARDAANTPVKKKLNAAAEMMQWAALASLGGRNNGSSSNDGGGSSSSSNTTNISSTCNSSSSSSASSSSNSSSSASSSSTANNLEPGAASALPPLLPAGPEFSDSAVPKAGKCRTEAANDAATHSSFKNDSSIGKSSINDSKCTNSSAASRWAALRESWRLADEQTNALMERASIDQSDPSTTPHGLHQQTSSSSSNAGLTLAAIRKSNAKALRAKGKGTTSAYGSESESGSDDEDDDANAGAGSGASTSSGSTSGSGQVLLPLATPLWTQWVRACQRSRAMLSSTILVQAWARSLPPQRTLRIAKKAAVTLAAHFRGSLSRAGKGFCQPEPEELSEADKGFLKVLHRRSL